MAGATVIHGRMSGDGRLVEADAPLLALQLEAGGVAGGPVVIPALAHLMRTAMRLGATIARPVTVTSIDREIALWARLKPDADGVAISIAEWTERPRAADPADTPAMGTHAELARDGWIWRVDARLTFHSADAGGMDAGHDLPRAGDTLTSYFRLLETDEGTDRLPMLSAVAAHRPFSRQPALLRGSEGMLYSLAALPTFDMDGRLTGYRGKAIAEVPRVVTRPVASANEPGGWSPLFTRRLDHALRQPLSRIIANADTISGQHEGPLRADYASYAADIAQAGRHLVELVDDLSDLQAIERPDFTVAREAVDIADLGRRAAGLLKMRAADHAITLSAPDADERVMATAEYRRVLQILVNLIGNAVRYSPNESAVWVRVDENRAVGTVSVIVADQGRGIDPADQERIFARFERLTPEDGAGSGLGLYISRRLARAMGGDISVESALGQGARFTLTLPVWGEG